MTPPSHTVILFVTQPWRQRTPLLNHPNDLPHYHLDVAPGQPLELDTRVSLHLLTRPMYAKPYVSDEPTAYPARVLFEGKLVAFGVSDGKFQDFIVENDDQTSSMRKACVRVPARPGFCVRTDIGDALSRRLQLVLQHNEPVRAPPSAPVPYDVEPGSSSPTLIYAAFSSPNLSPAYEAIVWTPQSLGEESSWWDDDDEARDVWDGLEEYDSDGDSVDSDDSLATVVHRVPVSVMFH
ncbi:hypothetical protein VTO73DRAFT_6063 [Trametes versicolor]